MQYKMKAIDAIGIIADAKSLLSLATALIPSDNQGGLFNRTGREGSLYQINPTLEVNVARRYRKELLADIEALEIAVFTFNGSPTSEDGISVAAAMKMVPKKESAMNAAFGAAKSNTSKFVVQGDDNTWEDINEKVQEYMEGIVRRRELKHLVQEANNAVLTVEISNQLLQEVAAAIALK